MNIRITFCFNFSVASLADLLQIGQPSSDEATPVSLPPPPAPAAPVTAPTPPPPAPVAPPPPCPPPPPNKPMSSFIPPPPAGLMQAPDGAMTIKRKVSTKYKLPTINWVALKPNQVRGTIFNELDDDKLHSYIDFNEFEEKFKIGTTGPLSNGDTSVTDGLSTFPSKRFKKADNVSLLEHTRLRNIGEFEMRLL